MKKVDMIKFNEANKLLNKPENMSDDECKSLWIFTDSKQCISCWKIPVWKRIKLLFHGKVWLSILSGDIQPPVWVDCENTVFEK